MDLRAFPYFFSCKSIKIILKLLYIYIFKYVFLYIYFLSCEMLIKHNMIIN
jgi:hypothetical protein